MKLIYTYKDYSINYYRCRFGDRYSVFKRNELITTMDTLDNAKKIIIKDILEG